MALPPYNDKQYSRSGEKNATVQLAIAQPHDCAELGGQCFNRLKELLPQLVQFNLLLRLPIRVGNIAEEGVFALLRERLNLRKENIPLATQFINRAITCHPT
jgi:hypothetical protein